MKARVLILLFCVACVMTSVGRTPFTKPVKKGRASHAQVVEQFDTLWAPPADSVAASGFEKTLRSTRESVYITNRTASPIEGLSLEISYFDISGRMLHKADQEISADIPAGETRLIDFPSFDRQGLYYYHLSPLPARARRATPFKASVSIRYILYPR